MSTDPLRRVRRKERIRFSATQFNTLIDTAAVFRQRQQMSTAMEDRRSLIQPGLGVVLIRNMTADDLLRGSVLGIDRPMATPIESEQTFWTLPGLHGKTPQYSQHLGKFAVLAEPIPKNKIGRAYVDGVAVVHLRVHDEEHRFADIGHNDNERLHSRHDGAACILWHEDLTDDPPQDVLAYVLIGRRSPQWWWGTLQEPLRYNQSADVAVKEQHRDGDAKGQLGETLFLVEAWCPMVKSGMQLPSGATVKVEIHPESGLCNVTASNECPEEEEEETS